MTRNAHIFQISASHGGVPKLPLRTARIEVLGLRSDKQNDPKHHGGVDRAVVLYALERIVALQQEGHPIYPGSIGENVTVAGLDWSLVEMGCSLHIGHEVQLNVTGFAAPCTKIEESFLKGEIVRVHQKRFPGWSRVTARVLKEGRINVGDSVRLIPADF